MAEIELRHIGYQVARHTILKEIDLKIEAGEFLTFAGPSGSGKSTLLKIIASLVTPTKGEVFFEKKKQQDYRAAVYRRQVSYCFQQPQLFGETVKENLAFPFMIRQQDFDEKRAYEGLESVKLAADFLTKPIQELSGGERQRVALLRNLMILPKALLLDEVTVGLDKFNRQIIRQLIEQLHQQGLTILQVTHDMEEISLADHLIYVEEGVLKDGTGRNQ